MSRKSGGTVRNIQMLRLAKIVSLLFLAFCGPTLMQEAVQVPPASWKRQPLTSQVTPAFFLMAFAILLTSFRF